MKTKTEIKANLKIQKARLKEVEDNYDEDSEYAEISSYIEALEWVLEI